MFPHNCFFLHSTRRCNKSESATLVIPRMYPQAQGCFHKAMQQKRARGRFGTLVIPRTYCRYPQAVQGDATKRERVCHAWSQGCGPKETSTSCTRRCNKSERAAYCTTRMVLRMYPQAAQGDATECKSAVYYPRGPEIVSTSPRMLHKAMQQKRKRSMSRVSSRI